VRQDLTGDVEPDRDTTRSTARLARAGTALPCITEPGMKTAWARCSADMVCLSNAGCWCLRVVPKRPVPADRASGCFCPSCLNALDPGDRNAPDPTDERFRSLST
jgi:hypothetical protein